MAAQNHHLNLRESLVYLVRQLQTRLIGHSNVADQYINGLFLQNPPRLLGRVGYQRLLNS